MRPMESASVRLSLKAGISPSQARFALANFCLDQLGGEGQALATVIELCKDVASLQQAKGISHTLSLLEKSIGRFKL